MRRLFVLILCLVCLFVSPVHGESTPDLTGCDLASVMALLESDVLPDALDLTGAALTPQECCQLREQYPHVQMHYTMELWGVTVSSEDTEATFEGRELMKAEELCQLLDCMPQLKAVYMYDKRLRLSELPLLFDGYPDVFFGLTIKINEAHTIRTDWTAYSTLGRQPQIGRLQTKYFNYLHDLKALDIGHMTIKTLDFLEKTSPLKILIVADCGLSDISPIACQTDLEYLELFKNYITDLSPLAGMTNLRDLNICYNQITDLSPLYDLPNLERLWTMGNWLLSDEEVARFKEHQPNCDIVTWSYGSTGNLMDKAQKQTPGTSWRHHPHYDTIHWIFHHNEYIDWDVPVPQIKTINDP